MQTVRFYRGTGLPSGVSRQDIEVTVDVPDRLPLPLAWGQAFIKMIRAAARSGRPGGLDLRFLDMSGIETDSLETYHRHPVLEVDGIDFTGSSFDRSSINHLRFSRCDLSGVTMCGARFLAVQIERCNMLGFLANNSQMNGVDIKDSRLFAASFQDSGIDSLSVRGGIMDRVNFNKSRIYGFKLESPEIHGYSILSFEDGTLFSVTMTGAMRDIVMDAVTADQCNFSRVGFLRLKARGATFQRCDFVRADFPGVQASSAVFLGCNFSPDGVAALADAGAALSDTCIVHSADDIPALAPDVSPDFSDSRLSIGF